MNPSQYLLEIFVQTWQTWPTVCEAAPKKSPWSALIGELLQEREHTEASYMALFAKALRKRLIQKHKEAQKKREEEAKK